MKSKVSRKDSGPVLTAKERAKANLTRLLCTIAERAKCPSGQFGLKVGAIVDDLIEAVGEEMEVREQERAEMERQLEALDEEELVLLAVDEDGEIEEIVRGG
jgi:hypothetical protein